ncbi:MAG TPA: CCA tRNA nucleotidyltransferase [Pirellulaceae bacterium]|nr:CCA tRNA nucleotidyltransferase [Pirellulaceae bacterium]HMO90798.1 CCA tRNA nucleotidyltransferase [Pirellulaceae bacterium]HMP68049.1 CCA tRNA nucleotidyltransferase [Pirellulaceae bacterium]
MPRKTPRDFAIDVVRELRSAGFEAMWAGGCVRDQVMGLPPSDFDVATNALPDQIREVFRERRTLSIGAAFGVITVLGPKSAGSIEVATFRQDGRYSDGRHPDSVTFSNAFADAQRRDFTINGLFYDPLQDKVIDYVDGQRDISNRLIRSIGEPSQRIDEDKLRMLRAVRFAAKFEFAIEEKTLLAIREHAAEIQSVSRERIGTEIKKMLGHTSRGLAYYWLNRTDLLRQIFPALHPETSSLSDVSPIEHLCRSALANLPASADPPTALACIMLAHQAKQSSNSAMCQALKWSNKEIEKTLWISANVETLANADQLPWSIVQPLIISPFCPDALTVGKALFALRGQSDSGLRFCTLKLELPKDSLDPPHLLTGSDLMQLNIKPGPVFARILNRTRQLQLDDELHTREDALELAKQMAKVDM